MNNQNDLLTKNVNPNGAGLGIAFPLNTKFRYPPPPDLPLMEVPNGIFLTYKDSSRVGFDTPSPIPGTFAGITVYATYTTDYSNVVSEADVIRNEFVLKALPMKYTLRFLDFVSEKSRIKTGSSEAESVKGGFSLDVLKLIYEGSASGEISGEYQKSFETAFSYYVDQGKRYLIIFAHTKLTENYRDKLIGLDYFHNGKKFQTDTTIANDWIAGTNGQIDNILNKYFENLEKIVSK